VKFSFEEGREAVYLFETNVSCEYGTYLDAVVEFEEGLWQHLVSESIPCILGAAESRL
jgi:hypothetical protein